MSQSLSVQLPQFEGPLALLLYLIRKEEMDIFNIQINKITQQYLDYIRLMKEFDLELAGEFIAMASTLIHIKSRMLLPQYNDQGEELPLDDPRKELVQRLIEYQKYQEAAAQLAERPWLGRDQWARGLREKMEAPAEEIELEENALFSLIGAYRKTLKSFTKRVHKVAKKIQSIASRILEIKDSLIPGIRVTLDSLIHRVEGRKQGLLITFLSLLELGRMGFVNLYQSEPYSDIHIDTRKTIEADVIARVDEFDSHSESALSNLFAKGQSSISLETEFNEVQMSLAENQQVEASDDEEVDLQEMASDEEILAAELNS